MVQIYFLVVLVNLIMGFILTKDFFSKKFENFKPIDALLSSEILQVTVGCIGAIVGMLALFLRYTGNLLILGDLIPAVISIISGTSLFIEYIAQEENMNSVVVAFFKKTFLKYRSIVGFTAIVFAVIHFIAPSVELL